MKRRNFLAATAGLALASLIEPSLAQSSSWPDRPVKVIVPYAAGGATDAIARPWCEELSKAFGQQFVVENRGGASGMIGMEALVKSSPDGYTLIMSPNAVLSILPSLRKTPYDPLKDVVAVGHTGEVLNGFVIHPKLGIKSMKELIDYAKKNPGKLSYASSGNGTANHLRLEALKVKAGIDILHVPYRGGADALNDVLPGNVHMQNEPITLPHVKAGKLILLAINGKSRNQDFPNVPTMTEAGIKDADVPIWFGFFGPKGLPDAVVQKMNAKMLELAKSDEFKKKLWTVNAIVYPMTPDQTRKALEDDIKANLELIKAGNIKLE
ncbi:MAG: tripartite tricarboxylate transporter substrate binding protein [Hyphomicrobiaceae bacterium]|nr:tripartite tricarboxylate transporter substrate binding protein [Hyphomicrobiaceae bacterium]